MDNKQENEMNLELAELDNIAAALKELGRMERELAEKKRELEEKNLLLEEKNRELHRMSIIDPLTDLHNRRYFMEEAEKELIRSKRLGLDMSIILVDIDFFKKINDSKGHQVGDRVLIAVSRTLQSTLRQYDIVARFGGEEFIILVPDSDIAGGGAAAEKLRQAVEQLDPTAIDGCQVTISAGVSSLGVLGGDNIDRLIGAADDALYQAKDSGRNRVVAVSDNTQSDC